MCSDSLLFFTRFDIESGCGSKNFMIILTSRWYAKRFLHPDIVAAYEYVFIWDEDLGVDHFNGDEYVTSIFT